MIKYKLACNDCELLFDSWFASSKEFEKLKKKKLLICYNCNSLEVDKTLMAPTLINNKKNLNNSMNLTFNVSALDGASVQEVLTNNQGAVVGAIRDAANSYGQDFLPDVNVGYGGDG